MDESRKRNLILILVMLLGLGGYYAYAKFFGPEPQTEEQTAQQASEGESEPQQRGRWGDLDARATERMPRLETATVRGQGFEAAIDNLGGGVVDFRLVGDERFTEEGRPIDIVTTEARRDVWRPLRIQLARLGLPDDIVWEIEQVSPGEVRLSWEGQGLRIVRTFAAGDGPYQLETSTEVTNTTARDKRTRLEVELWHYVRRDDEGGGGFLSFGRRSPEISHGVCVYDGETARVERGDLAPEDEAAAPFGYGHDDVRLAAIESAYFVQAVAAEGQPAARCGLTAFNLPDGGPYDGTLFQSRLIYPWQTIEAGQTRTWRQLGYFGPKAPAALAAAGHDLPEVVDLGFFASIAKPLVWLLGFIHQFVSNWGLAIILLTVMIRLVLFPLTNLSFKSMARMRQLKPEIDRINEIYKDDAEKKGAAVMELYRKHKINPLAGCLPMVLQLPIWWALYTSLSTNIELYHMPFALWWGDLSAPDPYFVQPLMLGVLMHVQQRLTPTTADPMQAKMMMWFMPIMITVFMLFLPSGLCLYMLTNSALGIAQQKLNEVRMNRHVAATEAAAAEAPTDDDDGPETGGDDESSTNEPQRRPKRKRIRRARRG